jgi:hypothetical protein
MQAVEKRLKSLPAKKAPKKPAAQQRPRRNNAANLYNDDW